MQEIAGVLPFQQKRRGRFQASVATEEAKPQEEPQRRQTRAATKEQEQHKEYYLISALSDTITKSEEIWLIDSGASRHMTGFKQNLANYQDKKYKAKVELGDDGTYDIKVLALPLSGFTQVISFTLMKFFMYLV
jgi:hypothetical protein